MSKEPISSGASRPLVVLLHGIGRGRASMAVLEARLGPRLGGFEIRRIGYRSLAGGIDAAAEEVLGRVREIARRRPALHLVGHSMGGLVALRMRELGPDLPPGRTVQIGSPNLGSGLAGLLARIRPARAAFGPALAEMARPFRAEIPEDTGAIAGTGGVPGITRLYGVAGPNDGKVSVRSAWGSARHRTRVGASHALLPFSAAVARQTASFLRYGHFEGKP